MIFKLIGTSLLVLLHVQLIFCSDPIIRKTTNGPVEGIEQTSSLGQQYYSFKGIPYAESPITGLDPYSGEQVDRRFKAPVPLNRNWTEKLRVDHFADFCLPFNYSNSASKFSFDVVNTSENCLFLNIFVPAGGAEKKTVLVWIHGGGFDFGNPSDSIYGPDFLISEDNIVVTIQYRLGIFGFMNLGTDECTGNMGLKDQKVAMKWIYDNAENFSGNRNEILLFGESAGGASVGFHLINEESRKYFNRAYLSSSSSFSNYAITKANHLQRMKDFVKINETKDLIEYLKTADSEFLSTQYPFDPSKSLTFPWVPTIEGSCIDGAFLTQTPYEIYNSEKAPVEDTMFSFNSKEILSFRPNLIGKTDPIITENWQDSDVELPFEGFDKNTYPKEYKESLEKLKKAYFPDVTNTSAVERGNIDLMSDLGLGDSVLKAATLQANANNNGIAKANTFLFRFSMDLGLNLAKILNNLTFDGAAHAEDLCYYFHCHVLDQFKLYDEHLNQKDATYDAIKRMVKNNI